MASSVAGGVSKLAAQKLALSTASETQHSITLMTEVKIVRQRNDHGCGFPIAASKIPRS